MVHEVYDIVPQVNNVPSRYFLLAHYFIFFIFDFWGHYKWYQSLISKLRDLWVHQAITAMEMKYDIKFVTNKKFFYY